jgi:hypothetical protein
MPEMDREQHLLLIRQLVQWVIAGAASGEDRSPDLSEEASALEADFRRFAAMEECPQVFSRQAELHADWVHIAERIFSGSYERRDVERLVECARMADEVIGPPFMCESRSLSAYVLVKRREYDTVVEMIGAMFPEDSDEEPRTSARRVLLMRNALIEAAVVRKLKTATIRRLMDIARQLRIEQARDSIIRSLQNVLDERGDGSSDRDAGAQAGP